jgi:hypothetical protein
MTKAEFRQRWESGPDGGGITNDDCADCAKAWGLFDTPRIHELSKVVDAVVKAACVTEEKEYPPVRGKEIQMEFKKAVKTKSWLRLAIDGVSGSGKTFTAIAVGTGMAEVLGGRVALIDTEHGSAALYADRFDFDTLDLLRFQIEDYIDALNAASAAQYPIVIIDSTSHAWDALVERVERIANQKYGGNTFRAWGEGTPLQKKLIEAMLNYPGHIIVTCRSKTEYSVDKDEKGKTTVKKVGTAAVQRQGFEYEFTMAMTMDANHVGLVTKDRTSKFQDQFIEKPGKELGKQLIAWLNEGAAPPPPPPRTLEQQCHDEMVEIGNILNSGTETGERYFTEDEYNAVKAKLASFPKNPPETRLAFISKLLDEQKNLLVKRIDFFEKIGTGDGPSPEQPQAEPETLSPSGPSKPVETPPPQVQGSGEEKPGAAEDDGFVDDIPEESPPKKPSKRTSGKPSINNKSPESATAELDIY